MKSPLLAVRLVVLLLTLRVIAAPVAARPDAPKAQQQSRFIVRVCAWAAVRSSQLSRTPAESLVGGRGGDPFPAGPRTSEGLAGGPARDRLATRARAARPGSAAVHVPDVRRC